MYDRGGGRAGWGGRCVLVTALSGVPVHVVEDVVLPVAVLERVIVQATLFNQSLL